MNEETRLFDSELENQNTETVNLETPQAPEKKGMSTGTIVAGVAGGGVVGAAAAAGAAYAYDNLNGDEAVAVVAEEGEALAEAAPVQEVHTHTETVHVIHEVPAEQPVEQPVGTPVQDGPVTPGSNHISGGHGPSTGGEVTTGGGTTGGSEESDVHVIGVDVVDNGQGGEAVIAYMEDRADGQLAAVIDVEGDGTVDVLAVDENGNQHFEENEFHDVSGEGIQTMGYIESYAMEQGLLPEAEDGSVMADYEEPDYSTDDQDYYTAMDATTPDYVNDADTGLYEA